MIAFLDEFGTIDKKRNRIMILDSVLEEHEIPNAVALLRQMRGRHYQKLSGGQQSGWILPIPTKKFSIPSEYHDFLIPFREIFQEYTPISGVSNKVTDKKMTHRDVSGPQTDYNIQETIM